MCQWILLFQLIPALLLVSLAQAQCVDIDRDGYGAGIECIGPDVDDAASSCTTLAAIDTDKDGVMDCRDACGDVDKDDYGVDWSGMVIGTGADAVAKCTTDGSTPCPALDGVCEGPDVNDNASSCTTDATTDLDKDGILDCLDACRDADLDDFGVDQTDMVIGTGADTVGNCTTDGSTACTFGDNSCLSFDVDDTASSCTTEGFDLDNDDIWECRDICRDADQDSYGIDQSRAVFGTRADQVGNCTTDGSTLCAGLEAVCKGPDTNDAASSCTTDAYTDLDNDGVFDCRDGCRDTDQDNYGIDQTKMVIGAGVVTVGECTTNGETPCFVIDAACIATDVDDAASSCTTDRLDLDNDGIWECRDGCRDSDQDEYGVDQTRMAFGEGAETVQNCTTDSNSPCPVLDAACTAPDLNDSASSCTDDIITDLDNDGVMDCHDGCRDADLDNYGINQAGLSFGAGADTVGNCTKDGFTPCALADDFCIDLDCDDADEFSPVSCLFINGFEDAVL